MTDRTVVAAAARAIQALDHQTAFARKSEGDDASLREARRLLFEVLERNGYEIAEPGSARIRKRS